MNYSIPVTLSFILCTFIISCSPEKNKTGEVLLEDSQTIPVKKEEEISGAAKIYIANCKVCHGMDGKKQLAGAKDLSVSTLSIEKRIQQITNGKSTEKAVMPGYRGTLTEVQIMEVARYLDLLKK